MQNLLERHALLIHAFDNVEDAIFLVDENAKFVIVNEKACRSLGYSYEELLTLQIFDIDPDFTPQDWVHYKKGIIAGKLSETIKTRHKTKKGHIFPVEVRASAIFYQGKNYSMSLVRDVSEQRQHEEELLLLKHAFNQVNEAIYLTDEKGKFFIVNEKASNHLGYTRKELLEMSVFNIDPNITPENFEKIRVSPEQKFAVVESHHKTKDGWIFPVEVRASHISYKGKNYGMALVRDLSERKATEKQLKLLNFALDHIKESVWLIDESGNIQYVNQETCRVTGYTRDELLRMNVTDIGADFPLESWIIHWQELKASNAIRIEVNHKTKAGRIFPVEVHANYFEFDGQDYNLAFSHDITQRKQAEEALQHSEKLLAEAQRIAHIGSWEVDIANNQLFWSDETYRIWEIDKSQCSATIEAFYGIVHPEDLEKVIKAHHASIENKKPYQVEHRLLFPDGRIKYIAERGEPFLDDGGNKQRFGFIGTVMDITEQQHIKNTLEFVAQRGWKKSGESFLHALTQYLAQIFRVDYVIIDKLGSDITQAETVALYVKGNVIPNISYDLNGTPCDGVANGKLCAHSKNVQQLFPDDHLLVEMQAESYVGLPLWNTNGDVIGLIAVLDTKPMNDVSFITSILQLVATSVAAELERQRSEQILRQSEHQFRILAESLPSPVFRFDKNCNRIYMNPIAEKIIGKTAEELLYKKASDSSPMNEDELKKAEKTIEQVLKTGQPKEEEVLFRVPATGEIYYFHNSYAPEFDANGNVVGVISISHDITERKRMEEKLRQHEQEFRILVETSPSPIIRYDANCRRTYVNPAVEQMSGKTSAELLAHVPTEGTLLDEKIKDDIEKTLRYVLKTGLSTEGEAKLVLADKKTYYFYNRYAPEFDVAGNVVGVVLVGHDITERKTIENELATREQQFRALAENMPDCLTRYDRQGRVIYMNPAFIISLAPEILPTIGMTLVEKFPHDDMAIVGHKTIEHVIETGKEYEVELVLPNSFGEMRNHHVRYVAEYDQNRKIVGVIAIGRDITERKRIEKEMHYHASYDLLTGLPNRRMFNNRLRVEILKAKRNNIQVALLFIDLDNFKEVNDMLGHETGDRLLVEAAARIQLCVRETDTVARLGGDEFVAILPEAGLIPPLERIARAIIDKLAKPFQLDENVICISGSIGIAVYPQDGTDADTLMGCADQAMYAAKDHGKNSFNFFTRSMQDQAHERLMLINNLRLAIEKEQLHVYYQPIIDVNTGKVLKAEALIRWIHPTLGMVSPAVFIPLAEETNLIQEIGTWVFYQAAHTAQQWNLNCCEDKHFKISINMSPLQLLRSDGDQMAIEYLQKMRINPNFVVIEITEGLLLDNSPLILEKLERLQTTGIELSLDDFGTGYSAISYLKKFNLDYLKIDRSFVKDLETDESDVAIAQAIVMMAHCLGLKIIAEGVETQGQRDLLASLGCEYIQGYFYAKPMPKEEFLAFSI